MRAESERHLEDYICQFPDAVVPNMQLIGRQIVLPSGRLDVLGFTPEGTLHLLELKLDMVKPADVLQLLRYKADLERVFRSILKDIMPIEMPSNGVPSWVHCTLVGYGFTELVRSIAVELEIDLITYGASFNFHTHHIHKWEPEAHRQTALNPIFDEFRKVLSNNLWEREDA